MIMKILKNTERIFLHVTYISLTVKNIEKKDIANSLKKKRERKIK